MGEKEVERKREREKERKKKFFSAVLGVSSVGIRRAKN